jgi:hypothetical protein
MLSDPLRPRSLPHLQGARSVRELDEHEPDPPAFGHGDAEDAVYARRDDGVAWAFGRTGRRKADVGLQPSPDREKEARRDPGAERPDWDE